jgi:hypothetical protein
MQLKRSLLFVSFLILVAISSAQSRKIINIPNIPGYQTLKCDFHMHTVFSDGTVWPTVRVQEAWAEGLDAISITDHIEYRPHSKNIVSTHNSSFEIAEPLAKELNIILVRGAEITRNMPPGHLNTLFIKNANLLERDNVTEALKEAHDQGAFIFWNHPCWKAQQPDTTVWWKEHTALFKANLINGIEVYNGEFCPEALKWAKEKKLTMFGNSDMHSPSKSEIQHRPMTLVFAKSHTLGGIKEALFDRRTVVYYENTLVGDAKYLDQLFLASLEFENSVLRLENESSKTIFVKNNSDIEFELELAQPGVGFDAPKTIVLPARHVTSIELSGNSDEVKLMKNLSIYYTVKNLLVGNDENLVATLTIRNL